MVLDAEPPEDDGEGDDAGQGQPVGRMDRLQAGHHAEPTVVGIGPGTVAVLAGVVVGPLVGGDDQDLVDRSQVVGLVGLGGFASVGAVVEGPGAGVIRRQVGDVAAHGRRC